MTKNNNHKLKQYFTILLLCFMASANAQVLNDDCQFATFIPDVDGYCSEPAEFTNVGATSDPSAPDLCFINYNNGVWFSFVPKEPAINIKVFGLGVGSNTIHTPKIVLFESCGQYLNCASKNTSSVELSASNLIIGQVYYLMIESADNLEGTFQLCIDDFTPTPGPQSDCDKAVVLCSKDPFTVESLNSQGDNPFESNGSCIGGEKASSWYVWQCDQSGTLTMELTPANQGIEEVVDDLDFMIFELPGGINDCDNRIEVRCMGSGPNLFQNGQFQPLDTWSICNRPTGMAVGETDVSESGGCMNNSNNYIAPLDMVAGTSYGMLINNYAASGLGFSLEFGGTGTFVGPEVDFEVEAVAAFECDKTINFTDLSDPGVDPIIDYTWNFGSGASPSTGSGPGPFSTVYESFGDKVTALTLESSRGCLVTKVVEFYVEPCCADDSTLGLNGTATDIACFGETNGQILAEGFSGNPDYQYSLDGINFQPSPRFIDLAAGTYELFVIDIKGCKDTTELDITQPTLTSVNAGQDTTIDLGYSVILDAEVFSDFNIDSIYWTPTDSFLNCFECLDPEIIPPGNTTYTITVIDENGCTATDEIQLLVNLVRPVYPPNIFSPNSDNTNDFFNIFAGPAATGLEFLRVYDRWGNLMYEGQPDLNDRFQGWDGFFNGKPVNPGVYAWMANVRFVDNKTLTFAGDVTVLR